MKHFVLNYCQIKKKKNKKKKNCDIHISNWKMDWWTNGRITDGRMDKQTVINTLFCPSIFCLKYQPNGDVGTYSPPATPHCLLNPNWPMVSQNSKWLSEGSKITTNSQPPRQHRPNDDRWNAVRSCQQVTLLGSLEEFKIIGDYFWVENNQN